MSSITDNKVLRWIAVPVAAVLGGLTLYTILWVVTYMAGCSPYEREGVVSIVSIIIYYVKQGLWATASCIAVLSVHHHISRQQQRYWLQQPQCLR